MIKKLRTSIFETFLIVCHCRLIQKLSTVSFELIFCVTYHFIFKEKFASLNLLFKLFMILVKNS